MTSVVASAGSSPKLSFAEYHWRTSSWRYEPTFRSVCKLDVFHERKEALCERWMDVDSAFQQRVGLVREHECAEDLHQLASFGGKNGSSQNAVVRSINDNLHEAGGFAALDGTRHVSHGASADF